MTGYQIYTKSCCYIFKILFSQFISFCSVLAGYEDGYVDCLACKKQGMYIQILSEHTFGSVLSYYVCFQDGNASKVSPPLWSRLK